MTGSGSREPVPVIPPDCAGSTEPCAYTLRLMMMRVRNGPLWTAVISATLLTAIPAPAVQRDSRQPIESIARGHDVSVAVAARGETLYEHDAGERHTPASVQKLFLSMALFDELGPDHRIATRVLSTKNRRAVGHLWVVGGGDPSMVSGSDDVGRLANRIAGAGIERVRGSVIVDSSLFASDWQAPGWQPWSRAFVNRPTALAVDGNGSPDPSIAFGTSLTDALEARGIAVRDGPRSGRVPPRARGVAVVRSAPLRALVTHMNTTSSNFYAEMLGKLLGARTYGPPGTIAKGARSAEAFTARHGVEVVAHDSSGLSYANRVNARGVVTLLEHARMQTWGPALRLSLPSPGLGTLASRLAGVPLHAKTGTLWNGSSALAGWVRLRRGALAAFAVLARGSGKSIEDAIVKRIAVDLKAPRRHASNCQNDRPRVDTRCHFEFWWKEIGPPARTPE
jgi:serine-type D-Ala-D-Ala carboxypeptidase/endopeptidase (penicillin-binding protein 4)